MPFLSEIQPSRRLWLVHVACDWSPSYHMTYYFALLKKRNYSSRLVYGTSTTPQMVATQVVASDFYHNFVGFHKRWTTFPILVACTRSHCWVFNHFAVDHITMIIIGTVGIASSSVTFFHDICWTVNYRAFAMIVELWTRKMMSA